MALTDAGILTELALGADGTEELAGFIVQDVMGDFMHPWFDHCRVHDRAIRRNTDDKIPTPDDYVAIMGAVAPMNDDNRLAMDVESVKRRRARAHETSEEARRALEKFSSAVKGSEKNLSSVITSLSKEAAISVRNSLTRAGWVATVKSICQDDEENMGYVYSVVVIVPKNI